MYVFDNNLQTIFTKMQEPPKRRVRIVRLPHIYDTQSQCFEDISKDADQVKVKTLDLSYEAPEPEIEFSGEFV